MTSEQWREAWRIFNTAREIPAAEHKPFVESESADPEIVRRVFELLDAPQELPAPPEPVPVQRAGTQVGRYLVGDLLGRGGMGEVYAARDTDLGRTVALKFLLPQAVADPVAVTRLIREAKAASALNHPNVLTIYEVIQSSSGLAIALELVEGKPLSEYRGSTPPVSQVVEIGAQVASALAVAHENGIVHRDIKPENLMLRPDGLVKVLDFGLARDFAGTLSYSLQSSNSGLPAGTLLYMSPELLRGQPATGASDVFSLGIVLYELAAGHHPFESPHTLETAVAMHFREPPALSTLNPRIPAWFDELLVRMLKRDPALRPSAREVSEVLSRGGKTATGRSRPAWHYGALLAATLILLAIVAGPLVLRHRTARNTRGAALLRTVPLTGMPGIEFQPAFSPDGKQVVYAMEDRINEPFALFLKAIGGGPPLRLPVAEPDNFNPAWSPDGMLIAFLRRFPDHFAVMTMAALGGGERTVGRIFSVTIRERLITWRPDQKALIVCDRTRPDLADLALWALPTDGSPPERVTSPPPGSSDLAPAFSPDGKKMAFIRRIGDRSEICLQEKPGVERHLTYEDKMESLAWMADGQSILFSSRRPTGRTVWRVSLAGGAPEQVPEIGADPIQIAISRQGNQLIYVRNPAERSNILRLDAGQPTHEPVKVTDSAEMDFDPAYSPDGSRLAFGSNRTGAPEIWVARSDGSNPYKLTSFGGPVTGSPRWSPDGNQLAFDSRPGDKPGVYVVRASGGQLRRLPVEGTLPAWSQDGRWIYFRNLSGKDIWKVPVAGGQALQVTRDGGRECFESLDGLFLYYTKPGGATGVWRMPVEGGKETEIVELRSAVTHRYWTLTGSGIYFLDVPKGDSRVDRETPTLKRYRFSTGKVEVVASPLPPTVPVQRGLSVSPDERHFLWVQPGPSLFQIMLVEGFH